MDDTKLLITFILLLFIVGIFHEFIQINILREGLSKQLDRIELQCTPEIPLRSSEGHPKLLFPRMDKVPPHNPYTTF